MRFRPPKPRQLGTHELDGRILQHIIGIRGADKVACQPAQGLAVLQQFINRPGNHPWCQLVPRAPSGRVHQPTNAPFAGFRPATAPNRCARLCQTVPTRATLCPSPLHTRTPQLSKPPLDP